jgi:hypothetical protein
MENAFGFSSLLNGQKYEENLIHGARAPRSPHMTVVMQTNRSGAAGENDL